MRLVVFLLALSACERDGASDTPGSVLVEDDRPAPVEAIGVSPLDFRCETVASPTAVAGAVGVKVAMVDSQMTPPHGVPRTCVYASEDPAAPLSWSFDIDCRSNAITTGESMMVEYAGEPGAQPVMVGRSGIDAAGSVLLFIDDDAPCYVRVLGPEAGKRAALANVIAERLVPRNAPGKVTFQ